MLASRFASSSVRLRYSLDGGATWTETDDQQVKLTDDEVSRIAPQQGIIVGLVGTSETYTITILPGKEISASRLIQNEWTNRLVGDTVGLQWRLSEADPWQDYTDDVTFAGACVVYVRYRATGTHIAGASNHYSFKADSEQNVHESFVPYSDVSLFDFSSQQDTGSDHAAKNMFDENPLTGYHSAYSGDSERYVSAALDRSRYILAIDYVPAGQNGRAKKLEILVSEDGQTWTTVAVQDGLANDSSTKHLSFTPTLARYVRIHALETYGNSAGESNRYFSGKLVNFYEDTTLAAQEEDAQVSYSETGPTNHDVVATLIWPEGASTSETTHTFSENGSYSFSYTTSRGEAKTVEATVSNIDKVAPTARIIYSPDTAGAREVCASLTDISSDVVSIDGFPQTTGKNGDTTAFDQLCYVFRANGQARFTLTDAAGNTSVLTAVVDWISEDSDETTLANTGDEGTSEGTGTGSDDTSTPTSDPDTSEKAGRESGTTTPTDPAIETEPSGPANQTDPETPADPVSTESNTDKDTTEEPEVSKPDDGVATESSSAGTGAQASSQNMPAVQGSDATLPHIGTTPVVKDAVPAPVAAIRTALTGAITSAVANTNEPAETKSSKDVSSTLANSSTTSSEVSSTESAAPEETLNSDQAKADTTQKVQAQTEKKASTQDALLERIIQIALALGVGAAIIFALIKRPRRNE